MVSSVDISYSTKGWNRRVFGVDEEKLRKTWHLRKNQKFAYPGSSVVYYFDQSSKLCRYWPDPKTDINMTVDADPAEIKDRLIKFDEFRPTKDEKFILNRLNYEGIVFATRNSFPRGGPNSDDWVEFWTEVPYKTVEKHGRYTEVFYQGDKDNVENALTKELLFTSASRFPSIKPGDCFMIELHRPTNPNAEMELANALGVGYFAPYYNNPDIIELYDHKHGNPIGMANECLIHGIVCLADTTTHVMREAEDALFIHRCGARFIVVESTDELSPYKIHMFKKPVSRKFMKQGVYQTNPNYIGWVLSSVVPTIQSTVNPFVGDFTMPKDRVMYNNIGLTEREQLILHHMIFWGYDDGVQLSANFDDESQSIKINVTNTTGTADRTIQVCELFDPDVLPTLYRTHFFQIIMNKGKSNNLYTAGDGKYTVYDLKNGFEI